MRSRNGIRRVTYIIDKYNRDTIQTRFIRVRHFFFLIKVKKIIFINNECITFIIIIIIHIIYEKTFPQMNLL